MNEKDPPLTSYEGWWFWPISAAISFFGPVSLGLSAICPSLLPDPIDGWLYIGILFFFLTALFTGVLGFFSILSCGLSSVGRLSVRGRCLSGTRLGVVFLLMYLPAFSIALLSVSFYILSQLSR